MWTNLSLRCKSSLRKHLSDRMNLKTFGVISVLAVGGLLFLIYLRASEKNIKIIVDEEQSEWHRANIARFQAETDKIIKAMPPEPKGCPTGGGFIPDEKTIDGLPNDLLEHLYYRYVTNNEVLCHDMVRMGNTWDGGWEVCDDEKVRPRQGCVIYSFGINFDFSFDDMIAKHYGCEVHAFDPSMSVSSAKRSSHVTFYNLGLHGIDVPQFQIDHPSHWSLRTLKEIKQDLHHTEVTIDVLKMDIENSEWPTLSTAVADGSLSNVRQLLVEFHDIDNIRDSFKLLKKIRNIGFRIFHAHKNEHCVKNSDHTPQRTMCHELHMIHIPSCVR